MTRRAAARITMTYTHTTWLYVICMAGQYYENYAHVHKHVLQVHQYHIQLLSDDVIALHTLGT